MRLFFLIFNLDGLVKSPDPALCCISQSFNGRSVRLRVAKFARLEFELFTRPSKSGFLRVYQLLTLAPQLAYISDTNRYIFRIKIFNQRNQILAGYLCHIFELGRGHLFIGL